MTSIGIFDRLNFPASMANNTIEFSENTQKSLANLPPILTTWQMEDIANSNTSNYFVNPVSNYANTIWTTLISIETNALLGNLTTIATTANTVVNSNTRNDFISHTNRISGVAPIDTENSLLPQYNNCIGIGKALTYIIYQSDGISNNAVMMGNFGSLYTANTLIAYSSNLANDLILIQNSIMANGNSNLSVGQISSIISDINTSNNFIYSSVTQDVNFYNNSRAVVDDYNKVKGLGHMGDTEKYLVNNLIGSEKLKERISPPQNI
jgi:hypothetical protein